MYDGKGMHMTDRFAAIAENLDGTGSVGRPYDSGRATFVGFILASVLWWIPVAGPAVAGYYSGRRSGSFLKGAITSAFAGGVLIGLVMLLSHFLLAPEGFPSLSADAAAANLTGIYAYAGTYLTYFYAEGSSKIYLTAYGVMVAFGCIGGSLSSQIRRETAALLATGAVEGAIRPLSRSAALYERGKTLGFESYNDCISSIDESVNVMTEQNSEPEPFLKKKPVMSAVQTVTTTVGETPSVTVSSSEKSQSPFADILRRTEVRDKDK